MTLEELLFSFARLACDPVVVWSSGPRHGVTCHVWSNPAFEAVFGYTLEQRKGRPVDDLFALESATAFDPRPFHCRNLGVDHLTKETLCRKKDGSTFPASISITLVPDGDDGGFFFLATFREMNRSKIKSEDGGQRCSQIISEADAVRARLLLAIDAIPTPIAVWDRDWTLVVCNIAFSSRLLACEDRIEMGITLDDFLVRAAHSGRLVDAIGREDEWAAEASAAIRSGPIDDITRYTDGIILRAVSAKAPNGDTIVYNADFTEFTAQK